MRPIGLGGETVGGSLERAPSGFDFLGQRGYSFHYLRMILSTNLPELTGPMNDASSPTCVLPTTSPSVVRRSPNACHEWVLANLPGASGNDRLVVVLLREFGAGNRLELRQQTWADGLGWFTQSSLPISAEQLTGLRAALGAVPPAARSTRPIGAWHAESA